ncbi:hypothetical protein Tco_0864651, partial [Tanacetum coccineum]
MKNANSSSPPESPTSPISRMVRELNKVLESLDIVVLLPTNEPSCLEGELEFELIIEEEENVSSVIDAHLGQMVLGKPFVEESKLVCDQKEGTMLFEKNGEKVTYKMPHRMDRWKDEDYMEFDNIPSFYVAARKIRKKEMIISIEKANILFRLLET